VEYLSDLGKPLSGAVSSDAIEEALAASWQQARSQLDGQPAVARASVLTLVIWLADPEPAEAVLGALRRLAYQHPSRTLVLLPSLPPGSDDLQVWCDAGCQGADASDQMICGEQVVVATPRQGVHHLPSLADQLILPDLPAFLWWVGDLAPADDHLFERLATLADRVIVDSGSFRDLGSALPRIRRLVRRHHQPGALSDLTWARLTPWRELVSQFFDGTALRQFLPHLNRVQVEYGLGSADGRAQALLLVSWLAERLGWGPDTETPPALEGAGQRYRLRRGDEVVEVTIRLAAGGEVANSRGLARVVLSAGDAATFLVAREADGVHARTAVDLGGTPSVQRTVRLESADLAALLADELMFFRRDRIFEDAFAVTLALGGH
jgi:glucose-6-phosphate dehydrogenase assembly protein OpcA